MVVITESQDRYQKYDEIKYVEFLEFLGRCAQFKFKDLEEETMEDKLKMLLDEILPAYKLTRKEVELKED